MPIINWSVSSEDADLIHLIVKRAIDEGHADERDKVSLIMDLIACHANGNPLRLADMLAADLFNFGHDVSGIMSYMDRDTGQLTDHFRPRFSAPVREDLDAS